MRQKEIIVEKLIEEKQAFLLHMSSCNSERLKKEVEEERVKQKQMSDQFTEMAGRYEKIIEKNHSQMSKIKGFNKTLRV